MPLIRSRGPGLVEGLPPTEAAAALSSPLADTRWAAARALAGQPESVPALAAALEREPEGRVREAIFAALARTATRESAEAVLPSLRSDDAARRAGALDALRTMPDAASPLLAGLLGDPDPDVRLLICEVARSLPPGEASSHLSALLDQEAEPNICAAAVDVLAEAGDASALPALGRCAERFPHEPFLGFAIRVAIERLQSSGARD